jgi:succinate dehydrogenase/fumarate reductase flavoprotein subunit
MTWDQEADVVCVGSGAGGLGAAVAAAEAGAMVILVEKAGVIGGASAISSGQVWTGANHLEPGLGLADSEAEVTQYLEGLSNGLAVPALLQTFAMRGAEAVRFFGDVIGIPFTVARGVPDYYYPILPGAKPEGRYLEVEPFEASRLGDWADRVATSPYGDGYSYTMSGEWAAHVFGGEPIWECLARHRGKDERCSGAGLIAHLMEAALKRGVDVRLETAAVRLVGESGAVAGVVVSGPGGETRIRTRRGVVLAAGGYDRNSEFVRAFEALPESGTMCPPECEGDHLTLAADMGVIPIAARAPGQTPTFVGYKVPGEEIFGLPSYRMLLPGSPHSIVVNKTGRRFADDSFYPDVVTKVARFDGQGEGRGTVNWPAWLVFDQDMVDKYGLLPTYPGQPLSPGMAVSAGSLGELAAATGIDAEGLAATVARFNGFCAAGVDDDFGRGNVPWGRLMTGDARIKPNPNLAPVERGPFYAIKLEHVGMSVGSTGLPIDEQARVMNARGQPVPGLFAAGNAASWQDIGGGYNSGISLTRGLLQGYLAARAMTAGDNRTRSDGASAARG